jgi:hypothetical protein
MQPPGLRQRASARQGKDELTLQEQRVGEIGK